MIEIEPRHGDHHFINIKYGYYTLAFSALLIVYLSFTKYIYIQQWKRKGYLSKILRNLQHPSTWIILLIWIIICCSMSQIGIHHFSEEYITICKRLGRIGYSLIPLNIYLILRVQNSSSLNIGYYLQNLNLHKWISRLIFFLCLLHAIGFTFKWIKGKTISKFFGIWNFLGLIVLIPFIVLIFVSIRIMGRKNYTLFYVIHNVTAWLMVLLITLHARPGVLPIAGINIILLIYQLYLRFLGGYKIDSIKIMDTPNSTLQIIRVALPINFPVWSPGSHIRLNYPVSSFKSWIGPTHPFTIASIYEDNHQSFDLIIKKTQTFYINSHLSYYLTGPYLALPQPFFNTSEIVNIICGGSGISFGLPILQYFKINSPNTIINLIWCVKNERDLFIVEKLNLSDVQIFVTTLDNTEESSSSTDSVNNNNREPPKFVIEDEGEDHELLHQEEEIELQSIKAKEEIESKQNIFKLGRPKLDEVFAINNPTITYDPKCSWVLACGPDSLIDESRKWSKDHNYQFFSEKYEM
ncbi:AIM14 [Candida pseudojiufengensis]|uniref:AIM14 n=1 Tax=Candida pseudojiufengensis TaxID=497109 RepID=UPI0022252D20|nr:AIM14 [Candida pseudojiufengensis]KAI5964774.1 AIM14 [Candida pseudojiufengensis]